MDRIFHYTTLETLKLILSNKTIRLNSLTNVDDKLEGFSIDFGDMAKYIYVSSWTKDADENIPLWYMYTDKMSGIRIEADSDFLVLETDSEDKITNIINSNLIAYLIKSGKNGSFLTPVKYTNFFSSCINGPRGYINENIIDIGIIKPTAWSFQNEYRFRIYGINKKYLVNFGDNNFQRFFNAILNNKPNDISFVDVKFDINKFNTANFMLGPNTLDSDYLKLRSIVNEYLPNHSGQIQRSNLEIRFDKLK